MLWWGMFQIQGKLIYDIHSEAATRKGRQSWMAAVIVHPSIIQYYQYWVKRELGLHLNTPLFKAHVSVVRGEEPKKQWNWRKHHNRIVTLEYGVDLRISEKYVWLPVYSKELEEIRVELGLKPQPKVDFHLTVGNTKNVTKVEKPGAPKFRAFPWEQF